MPFHTDFRPPTLEEFAGNRSTVDSLQALLKKANRPRAYFFSGPAGCGKTTLARIMAKAVGCADVDYKEQNAADFRGIDSIRDILRKMRLRTLSGSGVRAWTMDECHKLTGEAQNALLKALEEPPSHVYFFLCTTDPQLLLKTIRSRCSEHEVGPLTQKQTVELLGRVCDSSGLSVPGEVLEMIARASQGHPREALTELERVGSLPERQMARAAKQTAQAESQTIDLCRALMKGASWKTISGILKGLEKEDAESTRRAILGYCSNVLLNGGSPQAYLVLDAFREPFYNTGKPGLVLACYEAVEAVKEG